MYCFWYSGRDGKGHWKTVGRRSEGVCPQTARAARAAFIADLRAGINPVRLADFTVGDAVDAYAAWAESVRSSILGRLPQYRRHLRASLHDVPLAEVTPALLAGIRGELMQIPAAGSGGGKKGGRLLAAQSVNELFAFVRAAVNRAIASGLWRGGNPFSTKRGGAWEALKVNNRRLRFFTPEEAGALLAELDGRMPQLHDMALLSLRTGLRATELFKLKGRDLAAHADVLHIISKGGARAALRIPADMTAMLAAYDRAPGEAMFQKPPGGKAFTRIPPVFGRAVRKLGLAPEDGDSLYAVTFHTFRHTFASWLAQSGKVSLLELQKLMRHRHIDMTLRYAHLLPGQESEKLSVIDAVLARVKRGQSAGGGFRGGGAPSGSPGRG
ncbi:MAG: site-specific integrase [Desulfovibrio sp.]|nr:site-specific integrase [Desulfovibrio sp.]